MCKPNKNKFMSILERYQFSKHAKIGLGIALVILLAVYIFLLYYENSFSITTMVQQNQKISEATIKTLNHINVFKNCFLIVLSMLSSSFISALLIDTNSKNSVITDLMKEDIFSNPEFYSLLDQPLKQRILNQLEKYCYFSGQSELQYMFSSMRDSVLEMSKDKIYYDKCSLVIQCTIENGYIEKHILRTINVKSYDDRLKLNEHLLMTCAYTAVNAYQAIDIQQFKIGGKTIPKSEIQEISIDSNSPFNDKSGYTVMKKYIYQNSIDINSKDSTEISLSYITRVPLSDRTYSCRMPYACKSFSFDFSLKANSQDYRLNTVAFGFIDDGQKTPNLSEDHLSTKVSFNNWIFPYDGVAVTICDKH